jgi:hypothetical protein
LTEGEGGGQEAQGNQGPPGRGPQAELRDRQGEARPHPRAHPPSAIGPGSGATRDLPGSCSSRPRSACYRADSSWKIERAPGD